MGQIRLSASRRALHTRRWTRAGQTKPSAAHPPSILARQCETHRPAREWSFRSRSDQPSLDLVGLARMTGMGLAWIGATTALGSVVRNANRSFVVLLPSRPSDHQAVHFGQVGVTRGGSGPYSARSGRGRSDAAALVEGGDWRALDSRSRGFGVAVRVAP
jgi:hypothetical protein